MHWVGQQGLSVVGGVERGEGLVSKADAINPLGKLKRNQLHRSNPPPTHTHNTHTRPPTHTH